jgi:hypothetical protein
LLTRKLAETTPHIPKGKRNLLRAAAVELVVLAPAKYYASFNLSHFERALNEAISTYAAAEFGLTMNFKFKSLPAGFTWIVSTEKTKEDAKKLLAAVDKRGDVQWKN